MTKKIGVVDSGGGLDDDDSQTQKQRPTMMTAGPSSIVTKSNPPYVRPRLTKTGFAICFVEFTGTPALHRYSSELFWPRLQPSDFSCLASEFPFYLYSPPPIEKQQRPIKNNTQVCTLCDA